jgi:hypothetical protein
MQFPVLCTDNWCFSHYLVIICTVFTKSITLKDYSGIHRLLSYMNKDEGSEVNHCCQVFAKCSTSVEKFICHIFLINFVIINFVTYKLCYV